jgi:hypothetical protein
MKVKIISVLSIFGISLLAKDAPPSLNSLLPVEQNDENLVFHLTFNDGQMLDLVSKEVAEVHGGSFTEDRNGKSDSAFDFSNDGYIFFPEFNQFIFDSQYTIAFWSYVHANQSSSNKDVIFMNRQDSGIFYANNTIHLRNDDKFQMGGFNVKPKTWVHYVFTFTGKYLSVYADSKVLHSNLFDPLEDNSPLEKGLYIGGFLEPEEKVLDNQLGLPFPPLPTPSSGLESFNGVLDDLRVYNKSFRSSGIKSDIMEDEEPTPVFALPSLPDSNLKNKIVELESKIVSLESELNSLNKTLSDVQLENNNLKALNLELSNDVVVLNNNINVLNTDLEQAVILSSTTFVEGWVYDPVRGWIYTDNEHYPLVYVHSTTSWHYYEIGSSKPRYFFNYSNNTWEAWDDTE